MSEEISPFGAENLPLKELTQENQPQKKLSLGEKKTFLITLLAGIIFILLIIILLLVVRKPQLPPAPSPSPAVVKISPSPVSTQSALPESLPERLESLEKNLEKVDLQQIELSFPILDFKLILEQKR